MSRALLRDCVDHSELAHLASGEEILGEIREYQAHEDWDKYGPEYHERLRDGSCLLCQQEKGEEIPKLPWIGVCALLLLLSLPVLGQATYSGAGTRRGTASYVVNEGQVAMGAGENVYCPAGASGELTEGTPTWGLADGVANLPTQCMNTAVVSTPSETHIGGGAATTWTPADGPALTALLNGSNLLCGDTIQLTAGQTYIDSATFTFPAPACDGGHWITVKSSGVSNAAFPAEGTRATPCIIGLANDGGHGRQVPGYPDYSCASYPTVLTAKIQASPVVGGNGAITFASGANHYRFIGIEVTKYPGVRPAQLVTLAPDSQTTGANHIIFDRSIIHGTQFTTSSDILTEVQAGINAKNSQWVALVNSWDYDTYCNSSCVDSQGFSAGTGAIQDGPFKLYNNLIATAGESFMLGGGGQGIGTPNTQDFEVRGNHSFKPLTWMIPIDAGAFIPAAPIVKNLGELKNGVRVFAEGNVFENLWKGQSDQNGVAVAISAKNQNNHAVITVSFDDSNTVTRVSGAQFKHACGNISDCSPADASNCPPGGCILEISDASRVGVDQGRTYRFCNGTNGCDQTGDLVTTATLTTTVPAGASVVTNSCVPGDCPSCKIEHVTLRFNEIMNAVAGVTINSGRSSHCLDEAAGTDHLEVRDNLLHGLSLEMINADDPNPGASGFTFASGQIGAVTNNVEVAHNTVAIEQGGGGGFGQQVDYTDTKQLVGFNIHDNVAPGPYQVARTNGSNTSKGYGGNSGLAYTFVNDTCAATFPTHGSDIDFSGVALVDVAAGATFAFSPFSPPSTNYMVTVNGQWSAITSSTSSGFTLTAALSAGDAITVRNLAQCDWKFKGNLIGTSLPGSGPDNSPYPDGSILSTANNNSNCGRGTDACILDGAAFTSLFANWQTRTGGDYTIAASNYQNSATDAATRPTTGKNPGLDVTKQGQATQGVRSSTYYPALTVTTTSLSGGTVGTAYNGLLLASAGASPFKAWWVETDASKCGGNCGTLPAGILIGRSGTVNGRFQILTASRAVAACGSAGTVACTSITTKQTVYGTPVVGQTVTLSDFEDGSGSQAHDASFNGTCTIRVVTTANKFSCEQVGTGFDSIASHQPNDLWKGSWSIGHTYAVNEQVVYGLVGYSSLQGSNTGHQPDTSPTWWQVYTVPPNYATGAVASFAPTTAGTFNFWVGVRDGAFQLARAAITLVVVTEGAHFVDLTWDASLGADSYNIYRGSSSSGPYAKQNGSPIVPTGWTDTAVMGGTIYYYVATAQNTGGESGYSNEAAVAVP